MTQNNNNSNDDQTLIRIPTALLSAAAYDRIAVDGTANPRAYDFSRGAPDPRPDAHRISGCPMAYSRPLAPEALLGDRPEAGGRSRRALRPFISWENDVATVRTDYSTVGTIGQAEAALETLFALGRDDGEEVSLAATSPSNEFVASTFSQPNLAIGVAIMWGIPEEFFMPFTMNIQCNNWYGPLSGAPLDRRLAVQVTASTGNGTTIYVPFAQRTSIDSAIGTPAASGSMQEAQVQVAQTAAYGEEPAPEVRIVVPSALAAYFGGSVSLMTAFSTRVAAWSTLEALVSGEPVRGSTAGRPRE
jgi:hypothetical protein